MHNRSRNLNSPINNAIAVLFFGLSFYYYYFTRPVIRWNALR